MTANDILTVAKGEIGTKESPANSNNVKYNTAYYGHAVSGSAYPWCMVFLWWCFKQAGASSLFYGGTKTASCSALKTYAIKHSQWVTSGYKAGDVVIFDFSGKKTATKHCGIVESVAASGTLTTIEGNTGTASDDNGGAVMRRTRAPKYITGAWRPSYTAKKTGGGGASVTVNEAKQIVKTKAGVTDATITFLLCYKYGEDLIVKLAKAMQ